MRILLPGERVVFVVGCQPLLYRSGRPRGEEVFQMCFVDGNGGICFWEGEEARYFSWDNELFGGQDVLCGGACEKGRPVGGFGSFYGLEILILRKLGHLSVNGRVGFLGNPHGL